MSSVEVSTSTSTSTSSSSSFIARLFKGAAGWQTYLAVVGVALAIVASVLVWFNSKLEAATETGVKLSQLETVKGEVVTLQGLVKADKETQIEISANDKLVANAAADVRQLKQLRQQDLATFDERVQRASEPALRGYASEAERDIKVVEEQRDGFAITALQASTAAWGLDSGVQNRRDALNLRDQLRAGREALKAERDTEKPQEPKQ